MANLITVQECEMLESVRIEAFAIMSGVADAVSAWFLPTGSGSAATILVGSSPFFLLHLPYKKKHGAMLIVVHSILFWHCPSI